MSLTTDERTGRGEDDQATADTSSTNSPDTSSVDADLSGIDEALREAGQTDHDDDQGDVAGEEDGNGDPRSGTLLAALKTLAPPYAFFETKSLVPDVINALAKMIGADTGTAHRVVWTSGDGMWQPAGIYQVGWMSSDCGCGQHGKRTATYDLEIGAPGQSVKQTGLTVDEAIATLRALRIIH